MRVTRRPATTDRPHGCHRAIGIAHVVAASALVVMGTLLVVESTLVLVRRDRPTIGGVQLFGTTVWMG